MTIAVTKIRDTVPSRSTRLRYALTRLATVGDQVLVSVANFGLTLAIGRSYAPEELASYGIGLSIGLMMQGMQRHALIIPLMLQRGTRVTRRRGGIIAAHLVVLCGVLLIGGAGLLIAHQMEVSRYSHLIISSAAACLIVYVQLEFARAILVKLDHPIFLCLHGAWYAAVSGGLAVAALSHRLAYETLLLIMCGAMIASALAIAIAVRPIVPRLGMQLLARDTRLYGTWAAVATATYAGYNHLPLLVLAALAAPIHAAAFVATRSLLQPLQILLRGLDLADKQAFSRATGTPYARSTLIFTFKLAALYAVVAGIFCTGAALAAGPLLKLAYGDNFASFSSALIAWAPAFVLASVAMPLESLVYARQEFRDYYIIRAVGSLAAIGLTAVLVSSFFEVGAIAACSIGGAVTILGTVILLLRGTRQ
jgi:O-antigen/teichoic acid export membrane protein